MAVVQNYGSWVLDIKGLYNLRPSPQYHCFNYVLERVDTSDDIDSENLCRLKLVPKNCWLLGRCIRFTLVEAVLNEHANMSLPLAHIRNYCKSATKWNRISDGDGGHICPYLRVTFAPTQTRVTFAPTSAKEGQDTFRVSLFLHLRWEETRHL